MVILNPFYIYIFTFSVVMLVANLKWSNYTTSIAPSLYIFFTVTFLIAFAWGYFLKYKKMFVYKDLLVKKDNKKENIIVGAIISFYFIEAIYSGGFPLLSTVGIGGAIYTSFGIPVFHVVLVTFHSFYTTHMFHKIISKYSFGKLIKTIILVVPALLILNRGMLMMFAITFVMLFVMKNLNKITLKNMKYVCIIIISVIVLIVGFGVLGNMRTNPEFSGIEKALNSEYIMVVGEATEEFKESNLPKLFFWTYIYMASPMLNLNLNIEEPIEKLNMESFVINTFFPDVLSKRLIEWYDITANEVNLISYGLNVATAFGQIYANIGWLGMYLFVFFIFAFCVLYLTLLKSLNSKYYITGLVTLNLIICMFLFSNMWNFSGLSLQLIYPLLLSFKFRK